MPTILDFQIELEGDKKYKVTVLKRGSSQPLARSTFAYDLSFMTYFEMRQLDFDQKDPHGRLERLKAFGAKLYEKLFTPKMKELWQKNKKDGGFLVLCLRLAPEARELEALPWETLYDGKEFLAAGAMTGLSRLPLDVVPQDDLPAVPVPLKMLALVSSPLDLDESERLQIEREQEILLQATNSPSGQGKLQVDFEDEAKLPIIESSLESGYQIFHYSGHGISPENGGGLLLENDQGKKRPTTVTDFLQVLEKARQQLRLAVISGCQTARTLHTGGFRDLARGLIRRKVPAVIAMQFSIYDDAGLAFAENLYPRLIEGQTLEAAVSAGRRALLQNDAAHIQADALTPVLFVSNSRPLVTTTVETDRETTQPDIDFAFHLPLPQLEFGFYGRRKEYRAIRDGLINRNQRAIIVHGIGGIGKTALIAHTASRLREQFQGVYAFDCRSGVLAPEMILLELHRYLELREISILEKLLHKSFPPDTLATYLGQALSQVPLLIIFDNFETQLIHRDGRHEIANDDLRVFLTTLVKTTPRGSRFLFTSRYLFNVDDKRVGQIQEIPLGDLSRPETLGLMQKLPRLTAASYTDKLRAFETFGGHPYALVTLDRQCGSKPLEETLDDAANVHTELREFLAIELSYGNLSERSRDLLNRLAAFREPVVIDAVHWVIGEKVELTKESLEKFDRSKMPEKMKAMNDDELLRLLQAHTPEQRRAEDVDTPTRELIGWGLLTPVEVDGEVRALAVHSLVRDFCRDKQKGETWNKHLRDAAAYYTNHSRVLREDDKSPAVVWSEMEAFELLVEAGEYEQSAGLLINVTTTLLRRWGFGRFLESQSKRIVSKVSKKTQAIIYGNVANILQDRGDYEEAIEEYKRIQKTFADLGDRRDLSTSMHQIGMIHQARGDYTAALAEYEESLKIREELGDRAGIDSSLHQIGMIHHARGDYAAALVEYEKSLKIKEELGDRVGVARSLHQIGIVYYLRGDYAEALAEYEKSLKILEELGDRAGVAGSLHQIGMIHHDRGDYAAALAEYEKSLKIKEELGNRAGVAASLGQMGKLFIQIEQYPEAFERLLTALSIFSELELPDAKTAVSTLQYLRSAWGARDFDAAWKEKTGEEVPDGLKDSGEKPREEQEGE